MREGECNLHEGRSCLSNDEEEADVTNTRGVGVCQMVREREM